ncbi:MAG: outer membrane beta-barrel protein [Xanthomarina gelatinilytica]|uniref:outer membrane beta-barrel protein n=1 Tax=Xanthomarina gelatinilytica TaxID=1137281 RepID=UPI003A858EBB
MSDKKHIDRIFQEKFKDFEVSPDPHVWKGIQDKLNQPEKNKKKVIPFWFRIAGVAALLLLLLTVGGLLWNNITPNNTTNTKVVDTENTSNETLNPSTETDINATVSNGSNQEKNPENNNGFNAESQKTKEILNTEGLKNNLQIAPESKPQSKTNNLTNTKASKKNQIKNSITTPSLLNSYKETPTVANSASKNQLKTIENSKANYSNNSRQANNKQPTETKNNIAANNVNPKKATEVHTEMDKNNTETQLQQLNKDASKNGIAVEETIDAEVEETMEEELNKTTLTIEEAIAANEELIEEEKDDIINRWQVYANIAPVYYNSMGKGSHIDAQFENNSKTGEVNTSYGVNVSYNLNKKLSIRTGLSSLNLSYDTNGVILYESIASANSSPNPLRNINLSKGNEGLTALSADNLSVGQIDNSLSPKSNAAISQRIRYFEIPVELNYRIGSKKLGLNVIAGFSSFILDGNEVYSELNDEKTYIGEANNIKSMSFSTNFGVGLDYKFSEKVKFNLEPTFKYQINAFESTSGNFSPYIIGIYTGFSYKF